MIYIISIFLYTFTNKNQSLKHEENLNKFIDEMIKSVKQMNTLDMISEAKHLYMQGVYGVLQFIFWESLINNFCFHSFPFLQILIYA